MVATKVSELEGVDLDYWVARAEGVDPEDIGQRIRAEGSKIISRVLDVHMHIFAPHRRWEDAGPIIEREGISVQLFWNPTGNGLIDWRACMTPKGKGEERRWSLAAETPLIAAMREYVASKYGDYVPGYEA